MHAEFNLIHTFDTDVHFGDGDVSGALIQPWSVFRDAAGGLVFADRWRKAVRRIDGRGFVTTISGEGKPGFSSATSLIHAGVLYLHPVGTKVLMSSHLQRSTLTVSGGCNDNNPCTADECRGGACEFVPIPGCALVGTCKPPVHDLRTHVGGVKGHVDGPAGKARLNYPSDIALGRDGLLYVSGSHAIRTVAENGRVGTLAGSTSPGNTDGPATAARFNDPRAMVHHKALGLVVADRGNHRIRAVAKTGDVTTLAGTTAGYVQDPDLGKIRFNRPTGLALDAKGDVVIADTYNNRLRVLFRTQITAKVGVRWLAGSGSAGFADGAANTARFYRPAGLASDHRGNIYVADSNNRRVRRVDAEGTVTTLAGSGSSGGYANEVSAASARFRWPYGVAVLPTGGLVVTDASNHTLKHLTGTMRVSTAAGWPLKAGFKDGAFGSSGSRMNTPRGVVVDRRGRAWIVDRSNHRLRRLQLDVACDDGDPCTYDRCDPGTKKCIHAPVAGCARLGKCVAPDHTIYRAAGTGSSGTGKGGGIKLPTQSPLNTPNDVEIDANGTLWIADTNNFRIRRAPRKAGPGLGQDYITTAIGTGTKGHKDGVGTAAKIGYVRAITAIPGRLLLADETNKALKSYHLASGELTTVVAAGVTLGANFGTSLRGMDASAENTIVFVSDTGKHRIVPIGVAGTYSWMGGFIIGSAAGTQGFVDGAGPSARFRYPADIAVSPTGDVYIVDRNNHAIRRARWLGTSSAYNRWTVTTIAGGAKGSADSKVGSYDGAPLKATFNYPRGIAIDGEHNLLIGDTNNHTIRRITPRGRVETIIGKALSSGAVYGKGTSARLHTPRSMAVWGNEIFVALAGSHAVGRFSSGQCGDGNACTLNGCSSSTGACWTKTATLTCK